MVDSQVLHQEFDASVEGGLGELNGTNIVLGDCERYRASMYDIAESAAGWHDAVAARSQLSIDHAVLVDDARQVHLGNHFDDARAADARDAEAARDLGEARVIRPEVRADDLESGLQGGGIDSDPLDGTGRRALTATDLSAFESGAGRAGAG